MGATGGGSGADAVRRFDLAVQRAVGAGLSVALAQAVAIAVVGRSLYPTWWWLGPGPAALLVTALAVAQCAAGRFDSRARTVFVVGLSVSAVLAEIAVGHAVPDVGTAVLPIVVVAVLGIGFLATSATAAVLGGVIIMADTLVPVLLRPAAAVALLVQTAIQVLILAAATVGGRAARRTVADEEQALDQLARAVAADRAATAARVERRELEREMHDTVLNTLTALGRSSLSDSPAVRRRCAADAEFLRTLRSTDDGAADLLGRLRAVVAPLVEDGFGVDLRCQGEAIGAGVPPEVVTAIVRAARESLTNAREHSGTGSARVDVGGGPGHVTVRVSDRGATRPAVPAGRRLGVRHSLAGRMADVGGRAEFRHVPGQGATVTLQWPR